MHTHTDNDAHITIVARGSIKVHGPTVEETIYKAGAVIDFIEGHPHEIEALEDDTRIVNIIKRIKQ
jgi:quercetin dioxygenase-like cupin family protein